MGKINVLDKHLAELIAAGEVVERPSSVIKELVENAIDSGATSITVEIKRGGIGYMRVTDNGCGIEKDDVRNAFLRNATSKIKIEDDLNNIRTLGFRGEALASISAVAKVELITRPKEQDMGTHYLIEGGEETLFEEFGCPEGTTIIVRNLFYNTPARLKFLKKEVSEANAIAKVLDRIVLSHPEVSFKFIRDNKQELITPGNSDIESTIYSVYGKEFSESLMKLDYKLNGVYVSGFVSKPSGARPNRNMQHFFINGRYVKSMTAMVALEEAFKGSIMVQKFPSCVMYIEIPYEVVDVNVHPSKIEVRFVDERPIFNAIYHAVKSALIEGDKPSIINMNNSKELLNKYLEDIKKDDTSKKTASNITFKDVSEPLSMSLNKFMTYNKKTEKEDDLPEVLVPTKNFNYTSDEPRPKLPLKAKIVREDKLNEKVSKHNNPADNISSQLSLKSKEQDKIKVCGEAFNTYIIVEKNQDELIFIDKHAAHERLIYEKLIKNKSNPMSQLLIEPIVVSLSKDEYDAVICNNPIFVDAGFELEDFGNYSVIVRSIPGYLDDSQVKDTIIEMAGYVIQNKKNVECEYLDWLYQNIACRAAIKAGNTTKIDEIIALLKEIKSEDPKYCPHGRPISITFKKHDIEKKFGRV